MASLPVYDRTGKEVGTYDLEWTDIAPRISKQLLHDAVVMYQANLRQGSHKTKSRSEVAGNRQKMYRQKGTGRARAGARRAAQRRGGGHVKHKQPTDYSYRLPRKAVRSGGFVLETLGAAFWALQNHPGYEDVVVAAVNLGDDADTVGAVAGALAGAREGAGALPERWLVHLRDADHLADLALSLHRMAMKGRRGQGGGEES